MTIKDWPEGERPREKLLAIFLRTGVKGKSAVDLARDLLDHFGGLRQLLEANRDQFCAAKGLGDAKYVQLQATMEISSRHLKAQLVKEDVITNPQLTRRYLSSRLRGYPHEAFGVLFLDNRHQIITFEILFTGTIDGASVHPREVVRSAMNHNAAALICAHNHPSGAAEPSRADRDITERLRDALGLIDVRLLDHVIVGDGESTTSLAELGWI